MQHVESTLGPDVPIVVWSPRDGARFSLDELAAYLAESKDRISAQLDENGGVLLRGFDCVHTSHD